MKTKTKTNAHQQPARQQFQSPLFEVKTFAPCATATATLEEVLQIRPGEKWRSIQPARLTDNSDATAVVDSVAETLRRMQEDEARTLKAERVGKSTYFNERINTALVAFEVEDALDAESASIAAAIMLAAGWFTKQMRVLTRRAQAEVKSLVLEAAAALANLIALNEASIEYKALCVQFATPQRGFAFAGAGAGAGEGAGA